MIEADLQSLILRELTKDERVRLFRNTSVGAWAGKIIDRTATTMTLLNPYPIHAGLFVGSGDLIGWSAGRFMSVEVKSPTGVIRPEQIIWRDNVLKGGGIAGIVRSVEEAKKLLS